MPEWTQVLHISDEITGESLLGRVSHQTNDYSAATLLGIVCCVVRQNDYWFTVNRTLHRELEVNRYTAVKTNRDRAKGISKSPPP
jgi:hypothetical protein